MTPNKHHSWLFELLPLLLLSLVGSSLAALAFTLRNDSEPVTIRRVTKAVSASLVATLIMFFALSGYVADPGVHVAVSITSGVGSWNLLDLLGVSLLRVLRGYLDTSDEKKP